MITYREFIQRYKDGSLDNDAGWRAYDIPGVATGGKNRRKWPYTSAALKDLGYDPRARQASLSAVAHDYGLATPGMAADTLFMWQIFLNLQRGQRMIGLPYRSVNYGN